MTSPDIEASLLSLGASTLDDLLADVAGKSPAPGGGAVVSAVAALAAALGNMVVSYSAGKKSLADHDQLHADAAAELHRAAAILVELADEDAIAYAHLNRLQRLDADDPARADLASAALAATTVPLAVAAAAADVLRVFERLVNASNPWLRSDLAIATIFAGAAVRAARWNVSINLPSLVEAGVPQEHADDLLGAATDMMEAAERRAQAIEEACRAGW